MPWADFDGCRVSGIENSLGIASVGGSGQTQTFWLTSRAGNFQIKVPCTLLGATPIIDVP